MTSPPEELDALRRAVEEAPTDHSLRLRLGLALYRAEEIDEAIRHLQQAKNDASRRGEAGYYLGQCFVKKKIYRLAITELVAAREALQSNGDDVRKGITYLLGRIYEQAGRKEQAVKEYSKIADWKIADRPPDDDEDGPDPAPVPLRR